MNNRINVMKAAATFVVLVAVVGFPINLTASHAWNNYHWARTSNPVYLTVVDSNTTDWDDNLGKALTDWDRSSVLAFNRVEQGDESARGRKRCAAISGKIRSCNAEYGFNGWLGLATISVSGGHITQGTSKMNDSYLKSGYTETNKQHVMCQEIGHDFGLGHQDESGRDLNTCMDYADALDNPSPNQHDYDMLNTIYGHTDSSSTAAFMASPLNNPYFDDSEPHNWGRLVSQSANGRSSVYERDNGNGSRTYTHVFWTRERAEQCPGCDHRYHH